LSAFIERQIGMMLERSNADTGRGILKQSTIRCRNNWLGRLIWTMRQFLCHASTRSMVMQPLSSCRYCHISAVHLLYLPYQKPNVVLYSLPLRLPDSLCGTKYRYPGIKRRGGIPDKNICRETFHLEGENSVAFS
jgi:hypothetical protein